MDVNAADVQAAAVAAAIGEPARARMLYALFDGRARTSTELAMLAEVSPSTASAHLKRLTDHRLVKVMTQGKHRYYALGGADVAAALEALNVLGGGGDRFEPSTPNRLREARTCYDHIAGALGVRLHDRFKVLHWLSGNEDYRLSREGTAAFESLGIDLEAARERRRRFAYPCVDWSERRPHLAGALGAALLQLALKRKWVTQELEGRCLSLTRLGRREMVSRFGLEAVEP